MVETDGWTARQAEKERARWMDTYEDHGLRMVAQMDGCREPEDKCMYGWMDKYIIHI